MANFQYTADLIADLRFRSREVPTSAWTPEILLAYLNRAYMALCEGGQEFTPSGQIDWLWLRKDPPGVLTLLPAIETGTVAVTYGSAAATLSSAPSVSVVGYYFQVGDDDDVYRVSAHTAADTALTLDSVYAGDTDGTATYRLMPLEYALASDVLRILGPLKTIHGDIDVVDLGRLQTDYPTHRVAEGPPKLAAYIDARQTLRFSHYPDDYTRVEYPYLYAPEMLTLPGTTEEPVVPRRRRYILADMALYFILTDKNDARAQQAMQLAQAGIAAMAKEQWYAEAAGDRHFGHISPRGRRQATLHPLLRGEL